MTIQEIQKIIDESYNRISVMSNRSIANKIESVHRTGNQEFKDAVSRGITKAYANGRDTFVLSEAKSKPLITPWGKFRNSLCFNKFIQKEITHLKVGAGDKRKQLPHLYYVEAEGPGEPTYEIVMYTPWGCAPRKGGRGAGLSKLHDKAVAGGCVEAAKNKASSACSDWIKKMKFRYPTEYYERVEPKREWLLPE